MATWLGGALVIAVLGCWLSARRHPHIRQWGLAVKLGLAAGLVLGGYFYGKGRAIPAFYDAAVEMISIGLMVLVYATLAASVMQVIGMMTNTPEPRRLGWLIFALTPIASLVAVATAVGLVALFPGS